MVKAKMWNSVLYSTWRYSMLLHKNTLSLFGTYTRAMYTQC